MKRLYISYYGTLDCTDLEVPMRPIWVGVAAVATMILSAAVLAPATPAPPLPLELVGDGDWLRRVAEINRLRRPLFVGSLALPPLALWLWVRYGWSAWLRRRLVQRGVRDQWFLVAAFSTILFVGLALLQLPLDYSHFVLRRAYGLATESQTAWLLRHLGEVALSIVLFVLAVEALYWLLRTFAGRWWLAASAGYTLAAFAFVYLYPLIITPLFFDQRPLDDPALKARVTDLAARMNIRVDEIFVINWSTRGVEGNAYFAGAGTSTRIVIYDTLLASPADELLAILAHELGHWREQHILKGLLLGSAAALCGLAVAHVIVPRILPRWGIRAPADIATLPLLLILLHLGTLASMPLQNWQSRRWEAEADQIALLATGDGPALARALVDLARRNLSDPTPPRLWEALFATHPATARRVTFLLSTRFSP